MNQAPEHIDRWIAAALAGEADSERVRELEQWINESADHRRYFETAERIYLASFDVSSPILPDVDLAWNKVRHSAGIDKPTVNSRRVRERSLWLWRAAAVILILAGTWWMLRVDEAEQLVAGTTDEVVTIDTTPGLLIAIDKESEIRQTFKGDQRTVRMKGRVYFEVSNEMEGVLIVEANDWRIRHIGTSFMVDIRSDDTLHLIVTEGAVEVTDPTGVKQPIVHAGSQLLCVKSTSSCTLKEFSEDDFQVWSGRSIRFRNAPMHQVVERLTQLFGKPVSLSNPEIGQCRITVRFTNESEEEMVHVIAETLGLYVEITSENVMFYGDGCH